jgi:short-subunit dehydrogenase
MQLKGKVIVITGGSSGIGKAAAKLFACEDSNVVLISRDLQKLNAAKKEICHGDNDIFLIQADVTKNKDVTNAVRSILEKYGMIDILINSAGMIIPKDIFKTTEEDWDTIMDINLKGTFLFCNAVIESMMMRKCGKIINISSFAGLTSRSRSLAYACAKAGVITLSRYLYDFLSPRGIQVSVVMPGRTYTPFLGAEGTIPEREKYIEPEDVAEIILQIANMNERAVLREVLITSPSQ